VLAEKLRTSGNDVTLVTPAERVAAWTVNTLEQHAIQRRLLQLGVHLVMNHNVVQYEGDGLVVECTYTARRSTIAALSVVTITSRLPNDELEEALGVRRDALSAAGIVSVHAIGDCLAPGTIAAAVYAGHRYAREFDFPESDQIGFHREMPT
jgi:dimethylamine/trimethylamine dehydrogenase